MEYKTEDGWNLEEITPLYDAEVAIGNLQNIAYELNNCVRTKSLQKMRDDLIEQAQAVIDAAEQIQDNDKLVEAE